MAYKRKSWTEKMNPKAVFKVERIAKAFADIPEGSTMLIATPGIVDEYVRNIPEGVHTSLKQIRKDLAATYHSDYTCPVTTGIFLRIVAEHAYEEIQSGKPVEAVTPFWRVIDKKSPTAKKLSFGTDFLLAQRKQEGLPF